jgi:hypothetical protein
MTRLVPADLEVSFDGIPVAILLLATSLQRNDHSVISKVYYYSDYPRHSCKIIHYWRDPNTSHVVER